LHAWVSGGHVTHVELLPWTISRTDVVPDPHPLFVAWGGPVWGCLIPLALWPAARSLRFRHDWLLRFFAGFCFIANGAYIGAGVASGASGATDTAKMLRHGCPFWLPIAFGLTSLGVGLYLWHGLGRHFGLGDAGGKVDTAAVWLVGVALVAVVVAEVFVHTAFVVGN
jgi:hypothetical protein